MRTLFQTKLLTQAYLLAVIVWGVLSYVQLLEYMRDGTLFARKISGHAYISDFVNTYAASKQALRCLEDEVNIYDPGLQDSEVRALINPIVPERPFYFQYPPHYFFLVLPLALVPMPVAWALWNVLLMTLCVVAMLVLLEGTSPKYATILILIALCTFPWWQSVQLGQTSLILFPLTVLFFELIKLRKFALAGITVGMMSIKLQYLPIFGMIGLISGALPFLLSSLATVGVLLLGACALVGPDNVMRFPQALLTGETGQHFSGVNAYAMQNFRGEIWLFLRGENATTHTLCLIAFVLAVGAVAWLWLARYRQLAQQDLVKSDQHRKKYELLASASILIALTFSLHTHTQDYILATLPCLWLWRSGIDPALKEADRLTMHLRQIVLASPGLSWMFLFAMPLTGFLFVQPFFIWALFLLALIMLKQPDQPGA